MASPFEVTSKRRRGYPSETHVKRGRRVRITAEADGFLYKMVRSLVGTLVAVGEGRISPEGVRGILLSRRRTPLVQTAPPQGLFLQRVIYR